MSDAIIVKGTVDATTGCPSVGELASISCGDCSGAQASLLDSRHDQATHQQADRGWNLGQIFEAG